MCGDGRPFGKLTAGSPPSKPTAACQLPPSRPLPLSSPRPGPSRLRGLPRESKRCLRVGCCEGCRDDPSAAGGDGGLLVQRCGRESTRTAIPFARGVRSVVKLYVY